MRWFHITVIAVLAIVFLIFALQNLQASPSPSLASASRRRSRCFSSSSYLLGMATGGSAWALVRWAWQGSRHSTTIAAKVRVTWRPPGKMPFDGERTVVSPTGASLNLYSRLGRGALPAPSCRSITALPSMRRATRASPIFWPNAASTPTRTTIAATASPPRPTRRRGRFGTPSGQEKVIADVAAIHGLISAEHPGLPVIVFGHSMGGLIALNYRAAPSGRRACGCDLEREFLRRPCRPRGAGDPRLGKIPARLRRALAAACPASPSRPGASRCPDHDTPFDWLSRDPDEVRKYIEDPLCGWDASVSLWQDLFGFVFHGADDRNFSGLDPQGPALQPRRRRKGPGDRRRQGGQNTSQDRLQADGIFESGFNGLRRHPPRKPERVESGRDHAGFRGVGGWHTSQIDSSSGPSLHGYIGRADLIDAAEQL